MMIVFWYSALSRLEQLEDLGRRGAIEIAGGLVGEQDVGSATMARAIATRCS